MKKGFISLIIFGGVAILFFSVIFLIPLSNLQINEGFESGLGKWTADADVPEDGNNPGFPVNWSIMINETNFFSGIRSISLFIDGRQDDGTIWIEQAFQVESNLRYNIEISFEFYCGMESFNTIASIIAYYGLINPEQESDMSGYSLGTANKGDGWQLYSSSGTIRANETGVIWIAIGITVAWETQMTYYLDDLQIKGIGKLI